MNNGLFLEQAAPKQQDYAINPWGALMKEGQENNNFADENEGSRQKRRRKLQLDTGLARTCLEEGDELAMASGGEAMEEGGTMETAHEADELMTDAAPMDQSYSAEGLLSVPENPGPTQLAALPAGEQPVIGGSAPEGTNPAGAIPGGAASTLEAADPAPAFADGGGPAAVDEGPAAGPGEPAGEPEANFHADEAEEDEAELADLVLPGPPPLRAAPRVIRPLVRRPIMNEDVFVERLKTGSNTWHARGRELAGEIKLLLPQVQAASFDPEQSGKQLYS